MAWISFKKLWTTKIASRVRFYWELGGAVVFLLICFNIPNNFESLYFHTFMRRDIDRSLALLKGQLIFFGPEASGGGFLPGPLVYFLLAGALYFYPFWQSCFWLLIQAFTLTALAGWSWFRRQFGLLSAFIWLGLLTFSHPIRSYVLLFLNLSYMIPFAFFAVITACIAFSDVSEKRRDRFLLITSLLVGLSLQLHFSIICIFLAIWFMYILAPRLRIERPTLKAMLQGLGVILVCCLPYFIWRLLQAAGWQVGQQAAFSGEAPGSFKTLMMLVSYSNNQPFWITLREALLRVFAIAPLSLLVVGAVLVANRIYERLKGLPPLDFAETESNRKSFRALLWLTFWAFFPFSYVFLVHMGRRYGMVFCFCLIIITLILQIRLLKHWRTATLTALFSAILAAAMAWIYISIDPVGAQRVFLKLLIALIPLPFIYWHVRTEYRHMLTVLLSAVMILFVVILQYHVAAPRGLRVKEVPRFHRSDWERIWRFVYVNSGWDYETAMQRTYFINLRLDEDPKPIYDDVYRSLGTSDFKAANPPDGFFVLNAKFLRKKRQKGQQANLAYLLNQRLPAEILDGLRSGTLQLGEPRVKGTVVIPYYVSPTANLPTYFHDVGEGYVRSPISRQLDQVTSDEGVLRLRENAFLFKWNECPDHHPFCSTGAIVELVRQGQSAYQVKVDVIGSAISQNSPWISPSWTQAWVDPYVEVRCGQTTQKLVLFHTIGMSREYGSNEFNELLQANNSVVAPFHREFQVVCRGPVSEISVGREGSMVDRLVSTFSLPARRLTMRLD